MLGPLALNWSIMLVIDLTNLLIQMITLLTALILKTLLIRLMFVVKLTKPTSAIQVKQLMQSEKMTLHVNL